MLIPPKSNLLTLTGEEFLRRFCIHILPKGFVRIRHYGIYSSRFRSRAGSDKYKMIIKIKERTSDRLKMLTGYDVFLCPNCKKGRMVVIETLPRIRSPGLLMMAPKVHSSKV